MKSIFTAVVLCLAVCSLGCQEPNNCCQPGQPCPSYNNNPWNNGPNWRRPNLGGDPDGYRRPNFNNNNDNRCPGPNCPYNGSDPAFPTE